MESLSVFARDSQQVCVRSIPTMIEGGRRSSPTMCDLQWSLGA